jgi:hypothetical protein
LKGKDPSQLLKGKDPSQLLKGKDPSQLLKGKEPLKPILYHNSDGDRFAREGPTRNFPNHDQIP